MISEITYQENKIKDSILILNNLFADLQMYKQVEGLLSNSIDDGIENTESISYLSDCVKSNFEILYIIVLAYLEAKDLRVLLSKFEDTMSNYLNNDKLILSTNYDDESGEIYSILINEYYKFLSPFQEFNQLSKTSLLKKAGLYYLEYILNSTKPILEERNIKITNEASIYNPIKFICSSVFKDYTNPSTSSFQGVGQCYNPDILIPSLACAVEYKYVRTKKRMVPLLDQILADVVAYNKNVDYHFFYAVFYTKTSFCTKEHFEELWDERYFPKNWKYIFIQG